MTEPASCRQSASLTAKGFGLVSVLFLTVAAAGQTPQAGKPSAPAMRTYTDAALHLTFSYPAELTPMDPQAAKELGQRLLYGEDNTDDSEKTKAQTCMNTLLAVGEDPDGSRQRPMARLALFDIDLNCLPPKAAKNHKLMDQVLLGLAAQGNEILGMTPMQDPVPFLLQGHHAFFNSAQGTPVSPTALQTAEAEVMATVAAEVSGHVLAWRLVSSDASLFKRLMACPVDLGMGQAQPLFPAQVR